jgi:tetratricopeptide (TPR) repeat protein
MNRYFIVHAALLLLIFTLHVFSQEQMSPVTGAHDMEKVTIDKYVFETALNSADRTITFLQWVIGVFSGVITILFVIFKYRDEKSLEKNRDELKESRDNIERIRLELVDEEHKLNVMLEKLQVMTRDYESKITGIERKISNLETKSDELDKKTDNMNEISRYFSIAYNSVESGNYSEAVLYYSKIIDTEPDELTLKVVLNNRGIAYQNLGKNDLALKDYQRVIDMDPNHPQSYGNRGNVYDTTGNFEKAIADYTRGIELKSDYTDAYYNRAWVYLKQKNYHAAAGDLKKLLELQPGDIDAMFALAEVYLMLNEKASLVNVLVELRRTGVEGINETLRVMFELLQKIVSGNTVHDPIKQLRVAIEKYGKSKWSLEELFSWAKSSQELNEHQKLMVKELLETAG